MTAGFNAARVSTEPRERSVAEAFGRSGFYAGHPPVVVRETHTAWVFLAGTRAYKIKKPVRTDVLDFSSLRRRRAACEQELRVNRELAPGIYLRLRAVVPLARGYVLVDEHAAGAVEYAIEMRRFDESRTMAALVERDALREEHVRALARRLAAFHAAAPSSRPHERMGDLKRACDANLCGLLALADDANARRVLRIERFTDSFLVARRAELAARAEAGLVCDGHGDLRAEHVLFERPLAIVDRLEFDPALREVDVADDLAFLVMDLEALGAPAASRTLVDAYREAGGDPGSDALIAFYAAHRALVRAKVALLRAGQLAARDDAAAAAARREAEALLALAERLAWRARGPLVLAVSGPPASGKSTLAQALGRRSGLPVLSSDALRKRRLGIAPDAPAPASAYAGDARAAIYHELGELAARRQAVIVDATFGDPRLRCAFLAGLGDVPGLRAIECEAPAGVRDRWARRRTPADASASDATPGVAARLGAAYRGWEELDEDAILPVRCGGAAEHLVDQVADWLDAPAIAAVTA